MILSNTCDAWNSTEFESILIDELVSLGLAGLPLQKALRFSSVALDRDLQLMLLKVDKQESVASITMGASYSGIIAGCSCSDDPTPEDVVTEYCEFEILLDRHEGLTEIRLCP